VTEQHQFQCQKLRSQAHLVCYVHTSHLIIRETKCCTCVIYSRTGHTVSVGGHTACSHYLLSRRCETENWVTTELVTWSLELSYYSALFTRVHTRISKNWPEICTNCPNLL